MREGRVDYPEPFQALVKELKRMPGIGARSAERIALWLVTQSGSRPADLAKAILRASEGMGFCKRCGFFSTEEECEVCRNIERHGREICVVEQPTDVLPIERTGIFRGLYHVLGGRLSPLDRVGPEKLRIEKLLTRVEAERPKEVILALSADIEGEATSNYLREILAQTGILVTRIAQGLPAGGGLEHADAITLQRALDGRR